MVRKVVKLEGELLERMREFDTEVASMDRTLEIAQRTHTEGYKALRPDLREIWEGIRKHHEIPRCSRMTFNDTSDELSWEE